MHGERLKKAESIFEAVVDLTPTERARALAAQCGDDEELRTFVEKLLASHDSETVGVLRTPVYGAPATVQAGGSSDAPEQIGPYRILDVLGEGGMGVVYLAEQTEPIQRRVALKLIKLGMDTKEVIARFETERQALALMNHANVASVLDAGSTQQGRPYFVMEHVPGIRITDYCDQQRLSTMERLGLFAQVCQAVQHAHQKGIIHRDIKPSNVLVAVHEGEPIPKVIDFGVAKATQKRLTEKTLFTEQGQLVGTPEYMSPEQAEMTALDIDTRTDIYSLGVLLYELLAGTLPFEPTSLRRAAYGEIQRLIREQDPPRPSTRLSSLGDECGTVAARRRTDAASLRRQLRGDLDWITMKAMDKDRTRRYATASALADDIARHLGNEPVLAGPPTTGYRLGKFIRRNRASLLAATLVTLALIGGTIGTSIGLVQAVKSRNEAQRQVDMTQAINDFLNNDLLAAVAPEEQGKDVPMREVLDTASQAVEGKFDDTPLIEASIRTTLGNTYRRLGRYELAEPHLVRALSLAENALGKEHARTLATMGSLAHLYRLRGRYDKAEPLQVKTLEVRRRVFGDEHPDTLGSMNNLASLYYNQGRLTEAEELYSKSLEVKRRILGPEHPDTLMAMNNLAVVYETRRRFDEAEALYAETLRLRRRVLGEEHPHTVLTMANLAALYQNSGRYDEAEPLSVEVVALRRRLLGAEHQRTLLSTTNLGMLLARRGRFQEAESLYVSTLEIQRRVLGEKHPDTLTSMNSLAALYENRGRLDEAERLYNRTLEIRRTFLGVKHPRTLSSMNNLGALYWKKGRLEEAGLLFKEAYENRRLVLGDQDPATHRAGANLLEAYKATGKHDLARSLAGDVLASYRMQATSPNASTKAISDYAWELLTCLAEELRDPPAALVLATKAVAATNEADSDKLDTLALAQHMTGDSSGAAETQSKAIALLRAGPSSTRTDYESSLAKYLLAAHRYAGAEPLLLSLHQQLSEKGTASPLQTRASIERLIVLYEAWHSAEPDQGYDAKAAEYRAQLPADESPSSGDVP